MTLNYGQEHDKKAVTESDQGGPRIGCNRGYENGKRAARLQMLI
jgi:hypothetical protein